MQVEVIKKKYKWLRSVLDERACRWWAGSEALIPGRGGITLVSQATGLDRNTVAGGVKEDPTARGDSFSEQRGEGSHSSSRRRAQIGGRA